MTVFDEKRIRETVSRSNRSYEYLATDWRDGLLLGNGSLAAISYAPGGMEWVINKNDVFDRRVYKLKKLHTHRQIMDIVKSGERETFFLDEAEKRIDSANIRSVTPCILRIFNESGELGWGAPAFPKISGELDLYNGELNIVSDAHFVHSGVKALIPRKRSLLALRMEGCAIADWVHKIELYRPYSDDLEEPVWYSNAEGELAFTQNLPESGSYAVALKAVLRTPDVKRVEYKLPHDFNYEDKKAYIAEAVNGKISSYIMNGGDVDIFVSVYSDYDSKNPLADALSEVRFAASDGFEKIESECADWWHEYWSKSSADFGKYKSIQDYWMFSMYELAASYGKAPMPALSGMLYGPLNPTSPGVTAHSYTSDQNIQIPLMPVSTVNHPELASALAETFLNAAAEMKAHTKRLFGDGGGEGIFIPLVSNQNGCELTSGSYRYTMCGGAYVALVLSRTWEYTRDDELMRVKLFPLISEILKFYVNNMLHIGDDGLYHLDATVPPEIFYFTEDDTATLAMLRPVLKSALKWCEIEGIENGDTKAFADVLSKYPPLAKRSDGAWWGGADVPEDHFSFGTHILYPFFPAEDYLTEEDREAARRTIDYIDREAIERTYAGVDGWHFIHDWSWHLYYSTLAHLGEEYKDVVWNQLFTFLEYFAKPNGLFTHNSIVTVPSSVSEQNHRERKGLFEVTADMTTGPEWYGSGKCASPNIYSKNLTAPVIEGNSIFLLRATEALLQSFDGILRIFPGVPNDFDGSFYNLRARGGFYVSAVMSGGKLEFAEITAKENSVLNIFDNGSIKIEGREPISNTVYSIPVLSIDLKAGETVRVVSK